MGGMTSAERVLLFAVIGLFAAALLIRMGSRMADPKQPGDLPAKASVSPLSQSDHSHLSPRTEPE
jgi:hypothetical protein